MSKQCGLADCKAFCFDYYVHCGRNGSAYNCFCGTVDPHVQVTPGSGAKGTLFSEPGWGFMPNGQVQLVFVKPDNTTYPPIFVVADANGQYSYTYN